MTKKQKEISLAIGLLIDQEVKVWITGQAKNGNIFSEEEGKGKGESPGNQ